MNSVPTLFQSVEVLWDLEGEGFVWWRAVVVEVESVTSKIPVALGVLQYRERNGYPPTAAHVEFLSNNLLRESKSTARRKNNPSVSWRSVDVDGESSRGGISDEDDWTPPLVGKKRRGSPNRGSSKKQASKRQCSPVRHEECHGDGRDERLSAVQQEVGRLHDSHAMLSSQLKRLQLLLDQKADRPRLSTYSAQHLGTKRFLLIRLLDQLNRHPRRCVKEELEGSDDCVGVQLIRVSTDCDVTVFQNIASEIHGMRQLESGLEQSSQFFPNFHETQAVIQTATAFHIVINNIRTLFKFLQVHEMSDRKSMMLQHASVKGEGTSRVAGSYVKVCLPNSDCKPIIFLPGTSSGDMTWDSSNPLSSDRVGNVQCLSGEGTPPTHIQESHEQGMAIGIGRESARWDTEKQSYDSPLRKCWVKPGVIDDPRKATTTTQKQGKDAHLFQLVWKKVPYAPKRRYTPLLASDEVVVGTLELLFPTIVVSGHENVDEVQSLLNEDALWATVSQ